MMKPKNQNVINGYMKLKLEYPVVSIDSYRGNINTLEIQEFLKDKINGYFQIKDNTETLNVLEEDIDLLDVEIQNLLKQKIILEQEMELVKDAEGVKLINKKIEEDINELKENNKLNKWEEEDDSYKDSIIENATYSFTIGFRKNVSWKTEKERYEIRYRFSTSSILPYRKNFKSVDKNIENFVDAMKYIENRKQAYQKYFNEEKPKMLKGYERLIECCGIRLHGYEIEE